MAVSLSLSGIDYSAGGKHILKALDLEVPEQGYFAIAGVNGAGKSTLIKLILDLVRPQSGQIQIFGADNRAPGCRDRVIYLPEKFDVRRNIRGQQYLDFVASIYRQKISHTRIWQLAEQLDFPPDRLGNQVGSYSKGMVQKLGLISCFMLNQPLMILDEPLSGLDPRARYCFKELVRKEKSRERTILYSTHMLADAEELCDQFGILHEGAMKYCGTPAGCVQRYQADSLEQAYMHCITESAARFSG